MFKLPKNRGLCAYFRDPRQDPLGSGGKLWFHATAHPTRLYLELTAARQPDREEEQMGYMRHNAIIVTSWEDSPLDTAHQRAVELFGEQVSGIVQAKTNGYASFFIGPDGSKEGWNASADGDEARASFLASLAGYAYDDGSSPLEWVEVQYGDDNLEARIVHDSDEALRAKETP